MLRLRMLSSRKTLGVAVCAAVLMAAGPSSASPFDRGGGWYNKPSAVRSALRYAGDDWTRQNNTLGFRVVRELDAHAGDKNIEP